jgi:hypothetical protein
MKKITALVCFGLAFSVNLSAQNTRVMGFMDIGGKWNPNNGDGAFVLGEHDLFIMSDITDKISFLGETVFKYSAGSATKFNIGVERAIVKYNYKGNHNISIGKVHTPVNYWNDSYHHGRVFFPTVGRPETFNRKIIPIHNIGILFNGANLGKMRFGYDVLIGNGLGSSAVADNDKNKSYTIAAHIKPWDNFRFGVSTYFDKITGGSKTTGETVSQAVYSASVAYFGTFEFLGEYSYATNSTFSLGAQGTHALYLYSGFRIKDSFIPYVRVDYLEFGANEMYYTDTKLNSYTLGLRYEINYLSSLKLEYNVASVEGATRLSQGFNLQLSVGFNYYD